MSDGSEPPPRQPRDIQGLLRLCMETLPQEPPTGDDLHPMDGQRSRWLSEAITSMTTDVIQEIVKNLEDINTCLKETTADGRLSKETIDRLKTVIDGLVDRTGSLDNAQDFCKVGGFDVFEPLFAVDSHEIKSKACELFAEVVQNEPYCQRQALSCGLLKTLVDILDKELNENVRIKSLYAISCLIRDNEEAEHAFESLDGLSVLLRAMSSTNPLSKDNKLVIKASFLMSSLCQKTSVCDRLHESGVLDQLVGALQGEHDSTHEYLLAALYAIVSVHDTTRADCRRREWGLKGFLKTRVEELEGMDECLEEVNYCKQLLELLFIDNDLPDSER